MQPTLIFYTRFSYSYYTFRYVFWNQIHVAAFDLPAFCGPSKFTGHWFITNASTASFVLGVKV
jgi:hypothetical protein